MQPSRKKLGVWQAHTNLFKDRRDMTGHSLALSPDGLTLATGGADGHIHLSDLASRQRAHVGSLHGLVNGLAFAGWSDAGRRLRQRSGLMESNESSADTVGSMAGRNSFGVWRDVFGRWQTPDRRRIFGFPSLLGHLEPRNASRIPLLQREQRAGSRLPRRKVAGRLRAGRSVCSLVESRDGATVAGIGTRGIDYLASRSLPTAVCWHLACAVAKSSCGTRQASASQ